MDAARFQKILGLLGSIAAMQAIKDEGAPPKPRRGRP